MPVKGVGVQVPPPTPPDQHERAGQRCFGGGRALEAAARHHFVITGSTRRRRGDKAQARSRSWQRCKGRSGRSADAEQVWGDWIAHAADRSVSNGAERRGWPTESVISASPSRPRQARSALCPATRTSAAPTAVLLRLPAQQGDDLVCEVQQTRPVA